MDLKEKYFEEITLLKNQRINRVVQAAKIKYQQHGIINTKIKEIAKEAEVGEASVYRYFTDKVALTKMVAFDYWSEKNTLYLEFREQNINSSQNGMQKLLSFLNLFKELYANHKNFLKFMEDFDNYMMNESKDKKSSSFEEFVLTLKEEIIHFVEEGHSDGSIAKTMSAEMVYAFISQVMVSTTQKLAIRVGYLKSDEGLDPTKVLDDLIAMFKCSASIKAS